MLKAALSGAGGQQKPAGPDTKIDSASFPCIQEGKPLADDVAATFQEQLNLSRQSSLISGSMPMRGTRRDSVRMKCTRQRGVDRAPPHKP